MKTKEIRTKIIQNIEKVFNCGIDKMRFHYLLFRREYAIREISNALWVLNRDVAKIPDIEIKMDVDTVDLYLIKINIVSKKFGLDYKNMIQTK